MVRVGYGWSGISREGYEGTHHVKFIDLERLSGGNFNAIFSVDGVQYSSRTVNTAYSYQVPSLTNLPIKTHYGEIMVGGQSWRSDKEAFSVTINEATVSPPPTMEVLELASQPIEQEGEEYANYAKPPISGADEGGHVWGDQTPAPVPTPEIPVVVPETKGIGTLAKIAGGLALIWGGVKIVKK